MKRTIIILGFIFLLIGNLQGQEEEKLSEINKAVKLAKQASKALNVENFTESKIKSKKALRIIKKEIGTNKIQYIMVAHILNSAYFLNNELDKAKAGCIENCERCEKYKNEYPYVYRSTYGLLASLYIKTYDLSKAFDILYDTILLAPYGSCEKIALMLNMVKVLVKMGSLQNAQLLCISALKHYEYNLCNDKNKYLDILRSLGGIYLNFGLYEKAEEYYFKALEANTNEKAPLISKKNNFANVNVNLATIYVSRGQYKKAENILLKIPEDIRKNNNYILNQIGIIYLKQNKNELAKKYFQKATTNSKYKDYTFYSAKSNLAYINIINKKYDKVEKYYLTTLNNMNNNDEDKLIYIRTLYDVYYLYSEKKDYKKATIYLNKAFQKTIALIYNNFLSLTEQEKIQYTSILNYFSNSYHDLVFQTHTTTPSITTDLFDFLIMRNKMVLLNTIKNKNLIENSEDPKVKELYTELQQSKYRLADKNTHPDTAQILNKKIEKLQKEISLKIYADLPVSNTTDIPTTKDLQSGLADNEAIIQYSNFVFNDTSHYCALVLNKNTKYPKFVYLCPEDSLKEALKKAPYIMPADYITNIYKKENKLYKHLFKPIEPHLKNITKINISPSGLVHNVAFACMKNDKNTYLKDKYQINYYNSFVDFISKKDYFVNAKTTQKAVLFGDMQYDLTQNDIENMLATNATRSMNAGFLFDENIRSFRLTPLPQTKKEVDNIADILNNCKIKNVHKYTGNEAIEEEFYALDNTPTDILHIATHGFYVPSKKHKISEFLVSNFAQNSIDNSYFKSGLFFSGAGNTLKKDKSMAQLSDGILSAYEVKNMNLENVKLVVLSACLTGTGDIEQNEGIIGLSRAFKIAGVENLIISLWSVPSYQTTEFMTDFYTKLSKGLSLDQAFRQTQQTMSQKYNNPYFWAGFVLMK